MTQQRTPPSDHPPIYGTKKTPEGWVIANTRTGGLLTGSPYMANVHQAVRTAYHLNDGENIQNAFAMALAERVQMEPDPASITD